MAHQDGGQICSARMRVQSPAWQNGFKGSSVAVAVAGLIPGLGALYAAGWPKKKKRKTNQPEDTWNAVIPLRVRTRQASRVFGVTWLRLYNSSYVRRVSPHLVLSVCVFY